MTAVNDRPIAGSVSAGRRVVLDNISQRYTTDSGDTVHAVSDTSITVESGEFVCIVGPSGCGKSTLMDMLAGFLTPTQGTVTIGGEKVLGPGQDRGVVFQQPNLYPWLSVRKNVELGLKLRKIPASVRQDEAKRYLKMVGLEQFMDRKPYELSGGMQQRCQIARVLANDPEIILMDEPFGALDALTRERMQVELLEIWRKRKKTVFFITHSVEEAIFLGTRVLVMSARPGRIILDEAINISDENGSPLGAELRSAPEFVRLRDKVSTAIYEAQGVTGISPAQH
ncbi:ABC transporter ATP-binding protein [Paeniglutamicibacter sp. NPDC012692]|uniref:ABC transporter ATP-binding protein n=1 Tax=Paeniglutamicibacter sp. NPDC012692 TaxID=3364388 RepID=UPI0036A6526E